MKRAATIIAVLWQGALCAQVETDAAVRLIGGEPDRAVLGLAAPVVGSALITAEGALRSAWRWGTAQAQGQAIALSLDPAPSGYADGLLVRFLAPTDLAGALTLNVNGLGAQPLVRPDGLAPVRGQLLQGAVCEALFAGGRFVLMNASERGCPPGSLPVNDRYCIEQASVPNQLFYTGVSHCANRGGRLCTWDEYVGACVLIGAQLTGLFDQWEWIDDTSNHSQTADQAGRTTCQSQRSAGSPLTTTGDTRCCYHPR